MRVPTLTAGPPPNAEPAVTLMATRSSVFPGAYPLAEPAPEPRRHEGVKRPAASTEAPPALACSQRPLPGRGHRAPNGGSMPPISAAAQPLQRRRAARLRPAFPSPPPGSLPRAAAGATTGSAVAAAAGHGPRRETAKILPSSFVVLAEKVICAGGMPVSKVIGQSCGLLPPTSAGRGASLEAGNGRLLGLEAQRGGVENGTDKSAQVSARRVGERGSRRRGRGGHAPEGLNLGQRTDTRASVEWRDSGRRRSGSGANQLGER